jgi:hypothetical protein
MLAIPGQGIETIGAQRTGLVGPARDQIQLIEIRRIPGHHPQRAAVIECEARRRSVAVEPTDEPRRSRVGVDLPESIVVRVDRVELAVRIECQPLEVSVDSHVTNLGRDPGAQVDLVQSPAAVDRVPFQQHRSGRGIRRIRPVFELLEIRPAVSIEIARRIVD